MIEYEYPECTTSGDHLACNPPKTHHSTSLLNTPVRPNLFYQEKDHKAFHNIFTCRSVARRRLGGLLGDLLYLCDDVRPGESFPCW